VAVITKYLVSVVKIENLLPDLYSVYFRSEKKFQYSPGQFLHITLDDYDPSGQWPDSRCFSIQTNPSMDFLAISFTVKGDFTKRMSVELKVGKKVWLKLPYGNLFLRNHSLENDVFIAGGTGITPFLSLFTDDSFSFYKKPVLYFGVRKNEYNIFNSELSKACSLNDGFVLNIIDESIQGMLEIKKIFVECGKNSTYFISGPPKMTGSFRNYLISQNIQESRIITDDWE
jgi:predicted ferric reductase